MKPYIILIGSTYYPAGWDDYAGDADTQEEAVAFAQANATNSQWWEVVDLRTREKVAEGQGTKQEASTSPVSSVSYTWPAGWADTVSASSFPRGTDAVYHVPSDIQPSKPWPRR